MTAGDAAREADDAWHALAAYLATVFAVLSADRETMDLLILHAQRQGTVRPDVTTEDVLFSLAALGRAVPALAATAPQAWRRYLTLFLDGLRPAGTPPTAALTPEQLADVLRDLGPHCTRVG